MKKMLATLLMAVFVVTTLGACGAGTGSGSTSQDGKTSKSLTIWVEKSFSDTANETMEKRIHQYAETAGIEIKMELVAATDFMTKLNAAVEAKAVPDITTGGPYKVLSYYPNNPYMDMTELVDSIHAERPFLDALKEGTKIDGKNYFVPAYASSNLLFIRKDLLEAKNIPIPTTWDELFDAALAVSDPDNGIYGLGMGCGPTDEDCENTFRMINWDNGGKLFDADGNVVAASDAGTRANIEKYVELYNAGAIPPSATTWDPGGNNKSYLMGESAMVINAPTLYGAMKNDENYAELFENTVVINLPSGKQENTVLGIPMGWSIMEGAKNVEGAEEFIKYMCDATWYSEYMSLVAPVYAGVFEDCLSDPLWSEGANEQALAYVQNANGYYGYPAEAVEGRAVAAKQYFSFPVARMLNAIVAGGSSTDDALAQFEKEAEDIRDAM